MKITYPKNIDSKNLCIGITAPSSGLGTKIFNERIDLVIKQHKARGIKIVEGECLRRQENNASDTPQNRAADFNRMYSDNQISLIQPPWGGQRLIEILELIDYEAIKKNPKWIQGYSDISTLLFAITIKTGVATAHGTNFIDSIESQDILTENSRTYLNVEVGKSFTQKSSEKWQLEFRDFKDQLDTKFSLTEKTLWKTFDNSSLKIKGRLIGGCFDAILNLIGTPYGDLRRFKIDFVGTEGTLLYLENCDLNPMQVLISLYSMKYANWFDDLNGVIFGRSNGPANDEYIEVLRNFFSEFDFPVVYDADIGHKPPQMTLINGAIGELELTNGLATLTQTLS